MDVRALAMTAAVLFASPAAAAGPSAPPSRLQTRVDAYLEPYQTLEIFQGAVLIAHGDQMLLEKGYGYANVELGVRNTPAMSFRVASLTKVFTEVLIGCLVERGKLDLDAPLARDNGVRDHVSEILAPHAK